MRKRKRRQGTQGKAEDAGLIVVREDGVGVQHPICYYESISNLLYESKKERLDQAAAADTSLLKFTSPPKRRRWAERGKQAASHRHRLFSAPLFTCFRRPRFPLSLKNDSFTGTIVFSIAEPFGRVGRSAVRESGGTASPGASSGTNARQSGSGFCETCVKTWQSSPFFIHGETALRGLYQRTAIILAQIAQNASLNIY